MRENRIAGRIVLAASAALIVVLAVLAFGAVEAHAAVKNGVVRKNGYLYYYKNGVKVTKDIVKIKGRNYYFSAKGRGFRSLKNKKGNRAMSKVIDHVKFKTGYTRRQKTRACYRYIVKMTYLAEPAPDTTAKGWVYKAAKRMADNKGGKCYGFASLAAVAARAMGNSDVKVHHGKCKGENDKKWVEHCWVTVGKKVLDGSYDNSWWVYKGKPSSWKLQYFFKTYDQIKDEHSGKYSVRYKDGDVYTLK